jgi:hypothetical protein
MRGAPPAARQNQRLHPRVFLAALLVCWPAAAPAQQDPRPNEQEMFGGGAETKPPADKAPETAKPGEAPAPPPSAPPPAGTPPAAATNPGNRDEALLGNPEAGPQLSTEVAPENPLTIGGQLYLRAQSTALQGTYPDKWTLTSPNLLDTYFDARPNERVRAFIRGRVSFDPTAPPGPGAPIGSGMTGMGGALGGTGLSATGFSTFNASRGPNAVLDQMWIAFDAEHKVFVTAGKQHVKWGTGRFWTPTDYLHPVKRNPLDVFDARPGTTMLKLNVPWEARAWNFYAFGVIEDPNAASNTLGQVAGAARAEFVAGSGELGLDVLVKRDQKPRVGADLSVGVGDFDLYGDLGFRAGSEVTVVVPSAATPNAQIMCNGTTMTDYAQAYMVGHASGIKPQIVGGLNWSRKYNDNDLFTVGGEYFYNSVGYSDPAIYPALFLNNQINFFYTGRHYAALYASLPAPYSWNYTTFALSTIGNLSDLSFVSRIDYSVTLLTHLAFEAFAGVHYGHLGGEFRLGFDQPICLPGGGAIPPQAAPLVDLGVALRLKI